MKRTVKQLAVDFASNPDGVGQGAGSASFAAGKFYSYQACIAQVAEKTARVTTKRYSVTTSKHKGWVAGELKKAGFEIVEEEF